MKRKRIISISLIFIFVGLLSIGILRKEFLEVLRNAIILCYSCIGIG